jgi:hypothetical protein
MAANLEERRMNIHPGRLYIHRCALGGESLSCILILSTGENFVYARVQTTGSYHIEHDSCRTFEGWIRMFKDEHYVEVFE